MGLKKTILSGLFFLMMGTAAAQQPETNVQLKEGDLLFQDLDCGPLCDAIEKVTQGHNNSTFSHVGLLTFSKSRQPLVLEAIGDSVQLTPLEKFLSRTADKAGKPKVAVGRLKPEYQHLIPAALAQAFTYRGLPYDNIFAIDNQAYYCSELIYFGFLKANQNKPVFTLAPMTYIDPETKSLMEPWVAYFKKLNSRLPEGDPGLNPGGMSRSEILEMHYPFGQPDKLHF